MILMDYITVLMHSQNDKRGMRPAAEQRPVISNQKERKKWKKRNTGTMLHLTGS